MKLHFSLSALAALFVAQATARAVGDDGKLVVGYWMNTDVSMLNFSLVTHINYGKICFFFDRLSIQCL
jgi:hypothetical protein